MLTAQHGEVMMTPLDSHLLESVVRSGFGIDGPVALTRLRSQNNDVFRVESAAQRVILKVYGHRLKPIEEIRWEYDLSVHLHRNGTAVPRMISARGGEPFVLVGAGDTARPAALYQELVGRLPGGDADYAMYRSIGRSVGALYTATCDFQSRHGTRHLDLARIIRQGRALLRIRLADRPADLRGMLDLLDESEWRLAELIAGGLDWGVCQGDVALHNMIILADGSVAMVDFENAGYGWRAADLCGLKYDLADTPCGWPAFLDGFAERRSIAKAELSAIDWMIVPFYLYNVRWLVKAGADAAWEMDRAVLRLRRLADEWLVRDHHC